MRIFPPRRLPPGFLTFLEDVPDRPVQPRPAATVCLLREGRAGMEALLLRRTPRTRFIPGAYVFPGGTVDPEDGDPRYCDRLTGIDPAAAARTLALETDATPPPLAFWVAAFREAYEETGLLFALERFGPSPSPKKVLARRAGLLAGQTTFLQILEAEGLALDGGALTYMGHWVTPVTEPRRYDTRFFAARMPEDGSVVPHEAEMTDALWLTPADALERNVKGSLPLVFPTLRTLEELMAFTTVEEALKALHTRPVPRILPRLVETEEGLGIVVEE